MRRWAKRMRPKMQKRVPKPGEPRRISLDEIAFDDSGVDVQDESEAEAQSDDQDADDVEPAEDEADHEDTECEADDQPESDTSEETILLDSLPAEDSLTRELPGWAPRPAVDETIAMAIFPCRPFPRHARPRSAIARCRPSAAI